MTRPSGAHGGNRRRASPTSHSVRPSFWRFHLCFPGVALQSPMGHPRPGTASGSGISRGRNRKSKIKNPKSSRQFDCLPRCGTLFPGYTFPMRAVIACGRDLCLEPLSEPPVAATGRISAQAKARGRWRIRKTDAPSLSNAGMGQKTPRPCGLRPQSASAASGLLAVPVPAHACRPSLHPSDRRRNAAHARF